MKKVLFICGNENVDYQADCVHHGLSCLDDVEVFLSSDRWFMFSGNTYEKVKPLYGMGMSITNRIKKDKVVLAKEDIEDKIRKHYFDLIIYGSVYRCTDFLELALNNYKRNELAFIDGEDFSYSIYGNLRKGSIKNYLKPVVYAIRKYKRYTARKLSSFGVFFKREMIDSDIPYFKPIAFGMPEENFVDSLPEKSRDMAFIVPGKRETYIYQDEPSYYKGYQVAKYGITFKKAGWDCLRHYEILCNGCVPVFYDIDKMPQYTMFNFPKDDVKYATENYETICDEEYNKLAEKLLDFSKNKLTTRFIAEYILNTMGETDGGESIKETECRRLVKRWSFIKKASIRNC